MRPLARLLALTAVTGCATDPDADGPLRPGGDLVVDAEAADSAPSDATNDGAEGTDLATDTETDPGASLDVIGDAAIDDAASDGSEDAESDGSEDAEPGDADADAACSLPAAECDACAPNGCGGCAPLADLGAPCGPCALDTFICDGADGVICDGATPCPAFQVGTGTTAFYRPAAGDVLPIVQGIQGGFHVWGAIAATGVDPEGAIVRFRMTNTAGDAVASVVSTSELVAIRSRLELWGATIFVAGDVIVDLVDHESWRLCATLENAAGDSLEDCLDVTVDCCDLIDD